MKQAGYLRGGLDHPAGRPRASADEHPAGRPRASADEHPAGLPRASADEHQLSSVEAHHRRLEERLRELGRQPFLTPKEQLEVADIKKHKLRAKDEILALRRSL